MGRTGDSGLAGLVTASAALLAIRLFAATRIGFGDSEALYASYALHPQPAYLDHPGLIGLAASAIGGGSAPAPLAAHLATSVVSTMVPWTMALACRACGSEWPRCWAAALVFALAPEVAVGLYALTPDLLLALFWTSALALAAVALRSTPGSARAAAGFAAAGVLAGAAAAAKVTGFALMAGLLATYLSRPARLHARSLAPWSGLAAGVLVVAPIAAFEAHGGWPMLHHRFIDTQAGAALSWRNLGALVGGQVLYLSPLIAVLGALAGRALWRGRGDVIGMLLLDVCIVPLALLLPLCAWSRVAEPHWLAPALLALVPAAARAPAIASRRMVAATCAFAAALVAAVHAWVLVPSLLRWAPAGYDPRLDLANELYGWPEAVRAVRDEAGLTGASGAGGADTVVVGPHWVICAQVEAALRGELRVGCDTPVRDDFDDWLSRDLWRHAAFVVWVTDARFPRPPPLPLHATRRTRVVSVERAGRAVRTFTITLLARTADADLGGRGPAQAENTR